MPEVCLRFHKSHRSSGEDLGEFQLVLLYLLLADLVHWDCLGAQRLALVFQCVVVVPLENLLAQLHNLLLILHALAHVLHLFCKLVIEEHVSQGARHVENEEVEQPLRMDLLVYAPSRAEEAVDEVDATFLLEGTALAAAAEARTGLVRRLLPRHVVHQLLIIENKLELVHEEHDGDGAGERDALALAL